jgi:hypothetical protein
MRKPSTLTVTVDNAAVTEWLSSYPGRPREARETACAASEHVATAGRSFP